MGTSQQEYRVPEFLSILLKDNRVNLEQKDECGLTALDYAREIQPDAVEAIEQKILESRLG